MLHQSSCLSNVLLQEVFSSPHMIPFISHRLVENTMLGVYSVGRLVLGVVFVCQELLGGVFTNLGGFSVLEPGEKPSALILI